MKKTILFLHFLMICAIAISQTDPNVHWKLDGDGSDSGSEGADGTVSGAMFTATNKVQGTHSLMFDGVDDIMQVNDGYTKSSFNTRTYTAWINTSELTRSQIIFEEGGRAAGFGMQLNNNIFESVSRSGGSDIGSITYDFATEGGSAGSWHHVAVVFDGLNDTVYTFLDGVFVTGNATSGNTIGGHSNPGGIGGRNGGNSPFSQSSGDDDYFIGMIDDVRIYESALTDAEIFSLYDTYKPVMLPDLVITEITADTDDFSLGNSITFSAKILNGGFTAKTADQDFDVSFFINDVELSTITISNTAIAELGGEIIVDADVAWTSMEGIQIVKVVVDPLNQVEESNEILNADSVTYEVIPDFFITGSSVQDVIIENSAFDISVDISNRGLIAATGNVIGVRAIFQDIVIAYSDTLPNLASEDTVTLPLYKTPAELTEFNFGAVRDDVYFEVDYDNLYEEANEDNNEGSALVHIHEDDCRFTFVQGTSDTIIIEAEHYTSEFEQDNDNDSWELLAVPEATNGYAMAVPAGTNGRQNPDTDPVLGYVIEFSETGTYTLWAYCHGPNSQSNSAYFSFNSGDYNQIGADAWEWVNSLTFEVTETGLNTINMAMREDGFLVDKLVLSKNAALDPATVIESETPTQCDTSVVYFNILDSVLTYTGELIDPIVQTDREGFAYTTTYPDGIDPIEPGQYKLIFEIDSTGYTGKDSVILVIEKIQVDIQLSDLIHIFDGTPKSATITYNPDTATFDGVTITYNGSATEPTDVGKYELIVDITDIYYDGSVIDTLEIITNTAMIFTFTDTVFPYNGAIQNPIVDTDPSGVNLSYSYPEGEPIVVGQYKVIVEADQLGYTGKDSTIVIIHKDTIDVTLTDLSQFTDGTEKQVSFTLNPDVTVNNVEITYDGSSTVPTAAGTYEVIAVIVDNNYAGADTANLVLTDPAALTFTFSTSVFTYTGDEQLPTVTTSPAGIPVIITLPDGSPIDPGEYKMIVEANETGYVGKDSVTIVIEPVEVSFTFTNATFTFDGSQQLPTVTTVPADILFGVSLPDGNPINAGDYKMIVETNQFGYAGKDSVTITIEKAPVTITLGDLSQNYDGSAKEVSYVLNPNVTVDAVEVTYDGNSDAPVNAGEYNVVATIVDDNYEGSATGTLVITLVDGIFSSNSTYLEIYPNPASAVVKITNANSGDVLNMFDMNGRKVMNRILDADQIELDISELPVGIYSIMITNEKMVKSTTLVIE